MEQIGRNRTVVYLLVTDRIAGSDCASRAGEAKQHSNGQQKGEHTRRERRVLHDYFSFLMIHRWWAATLYEFGCGNADHIHGGRTCARIASFCHLKRGVLNSANVYHDVTIRYKKKQHIFHSDSKKAAEALRFGRRQWLNLWRPGGYSGAG